MTFYAILKAITCLVKTVAANFWRTIAKFGLHFIPISGHTVLEILLFLFRVMSYHESGPSQRIFLGGIPNVFILHNEYLIAGMKSGFIKIWNPLDRDPQVDNT